MRLLLLLLLTFCSSKSLGDRTRFIYPESGEMMHVEEGLSKPPFIRKDAATRSDSAYSECHLCIGPASNETVGSRRRVTR